VVNRAVRRSLPLEEPPSEEGLPWEECLPLAYTPRRRRNLLELDLGDGLILYDRDASLVHHLNPSAALVWRMCEGRSSGSELVQDIVDELGLPPNEVNAQVGELLRQFNEVGLTEDASQRSYRDDIAPGRAGEVTPRSAGTVAGQG
jgi:coenzyme PQQ synthesis protein D (PqqD)